MVMSPSAAVDTAKRLLESNQGRQRELDEIDKWLSKDNPVETFRRAHTRPSNEKKHLQELAYTPILELIVAEVAQQMRVETIHVPGDESGETSRRLYAPWDVNGLPSKQYSLWHAMLGYSEAHMLVLPDSAVHRFKPREKRAALMPFSPRQLHVEWNDQIEDEFPQFALRMVGQTDKWHQLRLYDNEAVYFMTRVPDTGEVEFVDYIEHGMGVCPAVTFSNDLDLQTRSLGEVDKYKIVAQRLNKTTADRMLAQHYNSWKVRYATGLEEPDTDQDKAQQKSKLAHEDVLIGGEGVQFGTLPETTLDGLLRAAEADRDTLAAISQTPVWALNGGQLVNLSADALSEARSMQRLKVSQKQASNGVGVASALRLAALAEKRWEDAERYDLQVRWEDLEARSLGAVADGLSKLNSMGVPPELLVEMIPGLSTGQVAQWRSHMESRLSGSDRLANILDRQLRDGINA